MNDMTITSSNQYSTFLQSIHDRKSSSGDCRNLSNVETSGGTISDTMEDTLLLSSEASDLSFDFGNMTRGELIRAAQHLYSEGKLSGDEAAVLKGYACAYAAAPGQRLPAQYSLGDKAKYNFLEIIKQASIASRNHGNDGAATTDEALLEALAREMDTRLP